MLVINNALLASVSEQARGSERLRMNFNLHESLDAKAQRLLNALEPGTVLPIHRHLHTAETYILLKGRIRVMFYEPDEQKGAQPTKSVESVESAESVESVESAAGLVLMREEQLIRGARLIECVELDPLAGSFGVNIPAGQWHTLEVLESGSVIFEVKDGPYMPLEPGDVL